MRLSLSVNKFLAELVKSLSGFRQSFQLGDPQWVSLDKMNQVSVLEQCNTWAAWWVWRHMLTSLSHSIFIKPCKNSSRFRWRLFILQSHLYGWACISSGTPANWIDENQGGSFSFDGIIYVFWCKQFLNPGRGDVLLHGITFLVDTCPFDFVLVAANLPFI